jgi:hypothetical protein
MESGAVLFLRLKPIFLSSFLSSIFEVIDQLLVELSGVA